MLTLLTCPKHVLFVRHAITYHTPFKKGPRKWNFEWCAIFCGKGNSSVLLRKKIPTAFDLEYLKQILYGKAERKDEVVISGKVFLFKDIMISLGFSMTARKKTTTKPKKLGPPPQLNSRCGCGSATDLHD